MSELAHTTADTTASRKAASERPTPVKSTGNSADAARLKLAAAIDKVVQSSEALNPALAGYTMPGNEPGLESSPALPDSPNAEPSPPAPSPPRFAQAITRATHPDTGLEVWFVPGEALPSWVVA